MIGRGCALDFGGLLHGLFSDSRFGLGLVGSGGGIAPAGKDQPPFGNANVSGKFAIPFGRPRLPLDGIRSSVNNLAGVLLRRPGKAST